MSFLPILGNILGTLIPALTGHGVKCKHCKTPICGGNVKLTKGKRFKHTIHCSGCGRKPSHTLTKHQTKAIVAHLMTRKGQHLMKKHAKHLETIHGKGFFSSLVPIFKKVVSAVAPLAKSAASDLLKTHGKAALSTFLDSKGSISDRLRATGDAILPGLKKDALGHLKNIGQAAADAATGSGMRRRKHKKHSRRSKKGSGSSFFAHGGSTKKHKKSHKGGRITSGRHLRSIPSLPYTLQGTGIQPGYSFAAVMDGAPVSGFSANYQNDSYGGGMRRHRSHSTKMVKHGGGGGNPWIEFMKKYGGKGYTREQLSSMYHER